MTMDLYQQVIGKECKLTFALGTDDIDIGLAQ
jgi:hypothetical protein